MQWAEVRMMFPDTFLVLEDLKSHVEDGSLVVEEVAVVRPLTDGKEVTQALRNCKGTTFIYHTKHDRIAMPIRTKPVYRGLRYISP